MRLRLCFIFQGFFFEIKVDGKIEAKVKNTTPQHWRNVKVWMAEARHGFPPANVQIKNLEHINPGAFPS